MKKSNQILVACLSLLILLSLSACQPKRDLRTKAYVKETFTMGTYVKITSYDKGHEKVIQNALAIAKDYDKKTTVNQSGSELDMINKAAGIKPVKVSKTVYALLKSAYRYSDKQTGFDMAIGALTSLWHIGFDDARKPSQAEIDRNLPLVSYKLVKFNDEKQTVYLTKKGVKLDLGAITKGYVADRMVAYLKKNGITTAIVDLGSSSLYLIGHSPRGDKTPWTIGIKDPNKEVSAQVGLLDGENESVATSGIYERYLTVDGKVYPHILNPKTGYPFDNDIQSVTIVSKKGVDGDALSTTIFALGTKKGYEFVEKTPNVDAIFVDKNNKVYITKNLTDKFEIDKDSGYTLGKLSHLK
ncbi:FAD:protein FMN transferase [Lactococcus insecticola]|uniref:FAD:protein FMN transferase n=1 Tax=Pseudolactococcus insecticola TaxID=2709158 RepID=A0A6A0B6I6_9LACT|nr:FAD:protein FMN transferase [Lactococcus insecticola]GFH40872.1 FAD:protein FMN transferase [Lactococcus insecticola]